MNSSDLGVVVIGRNEGERLIKSLNSVKSQASETAIVYVDSGSTDGSVGAARSIGAHVVNLDMTQPFTAARARNEGFRFLKTLKPELRFVQFIDGDCKLVDGWLEAATEFIAHRDDVAVVCGRRRELHPEVSVYNRMLDLEWGTPVGEAESCGGDSLVRIKAFEAVGGFRPQLIAGEEPELCVRLREKGWKIWRLDAEMTQHDAAMTRYYQWWLRTVRGGYGMAEVTWLHARSPFSIWRKDTRSSIIWGGLLPLGIVCMAIVYPPAAVAFLIYPLQIFRIALRRGIFAKESWLYATFIVLSMFAQAQGILRLFWRKRRQHSAQLIEYK